MNKKDGTRTTQTKERKARLDWNRWDMVFFVLPIILIILGHLDKNGKPKVRLTWGGPPGHWGVEIGMEDMEIPPSDFSQWGEYRLPLEPGVYVWHELQ